MIYLKLFAEFFKVSCFTFGGAYGAIPLIRDMVLRNGWIDEARLSDMIAISESTPGPIMVNLATYIGHHQGGFWGSLLATAAVVLPAYLVIILVTVILKNVIGNRYVQAVLRGLKPCVVGIVLAMGVYMAVRGCLDAAGGPDPGSLGITAALLAVMLGYRAVAKKELSPILLICISGLLGILVYGV